MFRTLVSTIALLSLILLVSCAHTEPKSKLDWTKVTRTQLYATSYDELWTAINHVFGSDVVYQTYEKTNGLIVTEPRMMDEEDDGIYDKTLFGKSWEVSYAIEIKDLGNNSCEVTADPTIHSDNAGKTLVKERYAQMESTLRHRLFTSINDALGGNAAVIPAQDKPTITVE